MAAASNVIPFGLLYMRPLQWWLKTKGFSLRGNPLRTIKVTRRCLRALDMWRKPWPGFGSSLSPHNASDGRIPDQLGSGHEWPPCLRSVEWSPSQVAHQLPGDAGHVSSTQTLSPGPKKITMCWYAPTTQQWFLISTTSEVCVRTPYTSWHTRSLGGPRTSSSR